MVGDGGVRLTHSQCFSLNVDVELFEAGEKLDHIFLVIGVIEIELVELSSA